NVEFLDAICPQARVDLAEREVHREQGREEHQFAGEPDDGSDRRHIGSVDRVVGWCFSQCRHAAYSGKGRGALGARGRDLGIKERWLESQSD
ncbi:MAG: hypothetical protein RL441_1721, partial [Actinomycetota bacterium]